MPPHKRITKSDHHRQQHYYCHRSSSIWILTFAALFCGVFISTTNVAASAATSASSNTDEKSPVSSVQPSSPSSGITPRDEIYIDDEGIEGSGGRGEIHDDLEKEPDYSGSGFGPDDEDSSTSHHNTHYTSSSSSGTNLGSGGTNNLGSNSGSSSSNSGNIGTGTGSGSISGGSSNTLNNRGGDLTNRKDTTRVTEYELGSGDGDTDDDDDEDDDDDDDVDIDHDHEIEENNEDTEDNINLNNNNNNEHDDHISHILTTDNKDKDHHHHIKDNNNNLDEDDNDEIYTEVTDPNEQDRHDILPDRSGETISNKDILKTNNEIDIDSRNSPANTEGGSEVLIMNTKTEDRTASFFAQPGILAAVIGGAVVGLLCAILVVMFIVYRMRKKDEGSYALDEPKRSPAVNSYAKNANNREFYA